MIPDIPLSRLRPITIFTEGDFHDLAAFLMRGFDAYKTALPHTTGRRLATPHLVARKFVQLFPEVDLRTVVDKLVQMQIPLDDTIEWDDVMNRRARRDA